MLGRITKGIKEFFEVCIEEENEFKNQTITCNYKGVFRKESINLRPLVGDLADVSINTEYRDETETFGIIEKIHERKNFLGRPPVANLDILFVVVSVKFPPPSYFFVDKLTATAVENDIIPAIIVNKTDLNSQQGDEIYDIYKKTGFKTIKTSAIKQFKDYPGFGEIIEEMQGKICVFAGESGVGKSSILNALFDQFKLTTGDLSEKTKRGRHTTRTVELFKTGYGGYVADTPGFGSLDFETGQNMLKENLVFDFPDLLKYAQDCRYTKCTHIKEEGCEIIAAVGRGELAKSRHESYVTLYEILKNRKFKPITNN